MDNLAAEIGGQTRQRYTIFKTTSTVQSSTHSWCWRHIGGSEPTIYAEIITLYQWLVKLALPSNYSSFIATHYHHTNIPSSGTNVIFLYISVQQNLFVHLLRLFQFIDMWVALPFIDTFVLLAILIYWICLLPFGPYVFVSLMSFSFC